MFTTDIYFPNSSMENLEISGILIMNALLDIERKKLVHNSSELYIQFIQFSLSNNNTLVYCKTCLQDKSDVQFVCELLFLVNPMKPIRNMN